MLTRVENYPTSLRLTQTCVLRLEARSLVRKWEYGEQQREKTEDGETERGDDMISSGYLWKAD